MAIIMGGPAQHWRGRCIKLLKKDNMTCAVMLNRESVIAIPHKIESGELYEIFLHALKSNGSGKIFISITDFKSYREKLSEITIVSDNFEQYRCVVFYKKEKSIAPLYFMISMPENSISRAVIKKIEVRELGKDKSAPELNKIENSQVTKKIIKHETFLKGKKTNIVNKKDQDVVKINNRIEKTKQIIKNGGSKTQSIKRTKQKKNNVIVYCLDRYQHMRVFGMIKERSGINQKILVPIDKNENTVIREKYEKFDVSGEAINEFIYYNNTNERNNIIKRLSPNIVVTAVPMLAPPPPPGKYKRVYVSHGMLQRNIISIVEAEMQKKIYTWKKNNLYCGATKTFADFIKHVSKAKDKNILLNALPQLDILHNSKFSNHYRDEIITRIGAKGANKIILFSAHYLRNSADCILYSEDYFKISIKLEEIARKNNWFIIIKPKQHNSKIIEFLKSKEYAEKYIDKYEEIQKSKNIFFLDYDEIIYRYFFVDLVILNGVSTVEIELAAEQKPVFVIRTDDKENVDYFGTKEFEASKFISDIQEIEQDIIDYFNKGTGHFPENQKKLIDSLGLTIDGKMTERVQDRLEQMLLEI